MADTKVNTFYRDLEVGKEAEDKVLQLLRKHYPCACAVEKFKGYDIWIPERHEGVEVKVDLTSKKTNNIMIEYEMFNKPSGILSTTAGIWVIYDGDVFMSFKPVNIIKCIFDFKLQHIEMTFKGDFASKKFFFIKKDALYKYGKLLS